MDQHLSGGSTATGHERPEADEEPERRARKTLGPCAEAAATAGPEHTNPAGFPSLLRAARGAVYSPVEPSIERSARRTGFAQEFGVARVALGAVPYAATQNLALGDIAWNEGDALPFEALFVDEARFTQACYGLEDAILLR